jgi:hypothetical protein
VVRKSVVKRLPLFLLLGSLGFAAGCSALPVPRELTTSTPVEHRVLGTTTQPGGNVPGECRMADKARLQQLAPELVSDPAPWCEGLVAISEGAGDVAVHWVLEKYDRAVVVGSTSPGYCAGAAPSTRYLGVLLRRPSAKVESYHHVSGDCPPAPSP